MRKALIFGITGQDGSFLAELLLSLGREVHGVIRRTSTFNTSRIDHLHNKLALHYGDILDAMSVMGIISSVRPDEIYNLAAQSHVQVSFNIAEQTSQVNGLAVINILDAMRKVPLLFSYQFLTTYYKSHNPLWGESLEVALPRQRSHRAFLPMTVIGVEF
jgi:GDPmannose 4,6-dehydratase